MTDNATITIYGITPAGDLQWYRHDGGADGTDQWTAGDGGNNVGSGWNTASIVFSDGAGVIYAVTAAGDLHWYRHDGWVDGTDQWTAGDGGNNVGCGWNMYATVFSGGAGVVYGITPAGDLHWYRHDGWVDGTDQWTAGDGGNNVGCGWNMYATVFSGGAGVVYGITPAGDLHWYRHDGWVDGTDQWTAGDGGNNVGCGWNMYATVFSGGAGVVYGITPAGDLHWYRHDGWADGTDQWTAGDGGNNVGSGWNMYATVFSDTARSVEVSAVGPTPAAPYEDPEPTTDTPQGPEVSSTDDPRTISVMGDYSSCNFHWYVPSFELVAPQAAAPEANSPFRYSYVVSGHDDDGEPVIAATITITARPVMTEAIRDQIINYDSEVPLDLDKCLPVGLEQVRAQLVIPYREAETGAAASGTVAAAPATPEGGIYTFVFTVSGNLARAAYGSLSRPGYQQVPPRLLVNFSFLAHEYGDHDSLAQQFATGVLEPSVQLLSDPLLAIPARSDGSMAYSPVSVTQSQSLEVVIPCADFGKLYVDATDPAHENPIGCQDTMALGKIPDKLYTPLEALATDDCQVFAAQGRPNVYLVLPRRYRVGRAAPGHPGVPDWSPLIMWIQMFDATQDIAQPCRLQANLQPDIGNAELTAVKTALADRTAHPTLLLPTSFGSGVTGFTVTGWNNPTSGQINATRVGDTIQVGTAMSYADAVVFNELLGTAAPEGRLVGNATFTLSDNSALGPIELYLDVTRLAGPWPDGPVLARSSGAAVTVENHAESEVTVTRLFGNLPDGSSRLVADGLDVTLPAGGSADISANAPSGTQLTARYSLADATPAAVAQAHIYVEDLHTSIIVNNDAHLDKAGITSVDIHARLDGEEQPHTFTITAETQVVHCDLVQPLGSTSKADVSLLHLQATVHKAGQPDTETGDYLADLHKGVLYQLSDVLATA